jgi:DNA-binding transcriptional ArsR family regulator
MTRFGVMKHVRVLEQAGLVVSRRQRREKHHFLNPVPIRLIHDRWIDKYTERHLPDIARGRDRGVFGVLMLQPERVTERWLGRRPLRFLVRS